MFSSCFLIIISPIVILAVILLVAFILAVFVGCPLAVFVHHVVAAFVGHFLTVLLAVFLLTVFVSHFTSRCFVGHLMLADFVGHLRDLLLICWPSSLDFCWQSSCCFYQASSRHFVSRLLFLSAIPSVLVGYCFRVFSFTLLFFIPLLVFLSVVLTSFLWLTVYLIKCKKSSVLVCLECIGQCN